MSRGAPVLALAVLLGMSACARAGAGTAAGAVTEPAPASNGAAILQRACTTCHDLGGLSAYSGSWGEPEWRSMVETMIAYGAQLTAPEVDTLAAYLSVNFGTEGTGAEAARADADSATSEGAALLQSACTTCHDLSGITANPGVYTEADFRDLIQRMIGYGAPVTQDQVELLAGYLTRTYGR